MELSTFAISFPIDQETLEELKELIEECEHSDGRSYRQILNEWAWTSAETKGFTVVAYDEERLVGVISAVDMIGVHVYEWSCVVSPSDRRQGVGMELFNTLKENMELRGAEGNLGLAISDSESGKAFMQKMDYHYEFSETTLEAEAFNGEETAERLKINMYDGEYEELAPILMAAFGDTEEEVMALIDFNSHDASRTIWLVFEEGEAVGTVTTVEAEDSLWITALAVHPSQTGKGIGSTLLKHCRFEAGRKEKEKVMLDVEIDNKEALSIYKRAGFSNVLQVDYYKTGLPVS
ncbi:GNAT family N-acetyltransferase [Chungangia koreensis]|uniref:GNAT family N-acetyltransferase n=1 Tax=Chungangia koreensis TaxID=752657 RepID=A0ABV8X4R5_9LACT